jgi:hypothetical protein
MRELGTRILQGCACTTPRIKRGLGLYRLACVAEDANFDPHAAPNSRVDGLAQRTRFPCEPGTEDQ